MLVWYSIRGAYDSTQRFCRKSLVQLVLPPHPYQSKFSSISLHRQNPRLASNSNILGRKWYERAITKRGNLFFLHYIFFVKSFYKKSSYLICFFPLTILTAMNRHYEKAGVPNKTRVIGFRVTDQELQKIKDAQSALRSIGISGTTSDTLRSILKDFEVEDWLKDTSLLLGRNWWTQRSLRIQRIWDPL